uniref:phosphatidylcholine transfer protein isoform X2 n=1 Tax=Panthera onca TaxID=9690 RepID=UPI0029540E8F|nr:phosphatidylcholine transfer protein isoform X2 [Panthera onca]
MECGAVGGFSEEQFREACAEIQQRAPAGANWELLVETLGFSIYGLLDQALFKCFTGIDLLNPHVSLNTGLYEYKVFGVLDDCPPALLADVYMDLDYRKQWDQYVKELYEKECNGETVVYWEVKYPFPMSNRDYIYIRQRQELDVEGRKIHVVLAQSTSVPQFAERPGVIRVNRYKQSLAIESDGKKGSKVFMYYFDNPGGQIPSWLINWVAKNGVPNFLKDMAKACQNYLKKT